MTALPPAREFSIDVAGSRDEALQAIAAAVEDWGATLERSDLLQLPVVAGLRRGLLVGRLSVRPEGQGSRVILATTAEEYHLETAAVAVLVIAGAGALFTVIWPLFPRLLPIAPFGAVMALSGWFLVLSRRQGKGVADFLRRIQEFLPSRSGI
jgi:hypothetical protein